MILKQKTHKIPTDNICALSPSELLIIHFDINMENCFFIMFLQNKKIAVGGSFHCYLISLFNKKNIYFLAKKTYNILYIVRKK